MKLPLMFQNILFLLSFSILLMGCEQQGREVTNDIISVYQPVEYMPRVSFDNTDGADGILVKFKGDIGSLGKARSLNSAGLVGKATFSLVPGLTRAEPLQGFTLQDTLLLLANDSTVAYAEPDYILASTQTPNDPQFSQQYGLENLNNPVADISALSAWDITTGSQNVVVAVIDSGVDYDHTDLRANIWSNVDEIPDNGIDDDQNGFIDDVRGWNFNSNNNDPMDDNNHGTHVAGIIGASGNNSTGVSGVNWNVKIMPLKFMNSRGQGRTSAAINALEYAVANGARVSNNSWGGGAFSQAMFDAIQAANSVGHLFIAAAGNDGINNDRTAHYPSNYNLPNIIAVAATDENDRLASFSNFGVQTVDVAAPGVSILSTVRNNQYSLMSGTSMATPFVTGAVGLILSQNSKLSVVEIRDLLLNNVDKITAVSANTVSGGRLNIYSTISNISSVPVNTDPLPIEPAPVNPVPAIPTPTPVSQDPTLPAPIADPVISSITVIPNVQNVAIGSSKQLTATGGVPPYNWSVDKLAYATIEKTSGILKALTVGEVNVTVTDSTGVVSDPYVISLLPMGILPKSLTQIGLSEIIVMTADGGVGPYVWKISDATIADMQPGGLEMREAIISPIKTGKFTISLFDTTGNIAVSNTIEVVVEPLVITPQTSDLTIGQTLQLSASGGTSPYMYSSVNSLVATVDGGGLIKANSAGSTTIRVTDFNDSIVEITISVRSTLTLDQSSILMGVDESVILQVSGGSGIYQWQTSNSGIATVSPSGLVRALAPGIATITVSDGSGVQLSSTVEIRQLTITGPVVATVGGANIQLIVNGGVAPFTWTSSNVAIATVDSNGLLAVLAPGTVSITAMDIDGFVATTAVTINANSPVPTPVTTPVTTPVITTGHH